MRVVAFVAGGLMLAGATAAQAAVVTLPEAAANPLPKTITHSLFPAAPSTATGNNVTALNQTVAIPTFDTSLGTLVGVRVRAEVTFVLNVDIIRHRNTTAPPSTLSVGITGTRNVDLKFDPDGAGGNAPIAIGAISPGSIAVSSGLNRPATAANPTVASIGTSVVGNDSFQFSDLPGAGDVGEQLIGYLLGDGTSTKNLMFDLTGQDLFYRTTANNSSTPFGPANTTAYAARLNFHAANIGSTTFAASPTNNQLATGQINIRTDNQPSALGPYRTDVSVWVEYRYVPVPEPKSLAILALGLIGLGVAHRMRRGGPAAQA